MNRCLALVGKTVMVTGGTGSFGKTVARTLLENDQVKEVIIYSRDEKKQYDMRHAFMSFPKLKFIIGDVRDRDSIFHAMDGVDVVFHAAALKHVPSCEFFPMEAVKTNVVGASNVLDAAEHYQINKVVVLSTDKAAYPLNAMGMTKALMEKVLIAKARSTQKRTVFCGVRYGNVMYSRGSVIPLFVEQIKHEKPLTVTAPEMTRFLLSLPHAVDLVLHAIENGENGDIFIRKAPASTVIDLAQACCNIFGTKNEIRTIGIREGEKIHETLATLEELSRSEDLGDYYRIKCDRSMDYEEYFSHGNTEKKFKESYTSENTRRLKIKEIEELLLSLDEIKQKIKQ